jgi:hypothetical protein
VPLAVIKAKTAPYMTRGKPAHRTRLMNDDDLAIISTCGAECRGIVQYYLLAGGVWRLNRLSMAARGRANGRCGLAAGAPSDQVVHAGSSGTADASADRLWHASASRTRDAAAAARLRSMEREIADYDESGRMSQ